MIYTDGIHLVTDGELEELHQFAASIGLKREWFQDHGDHPHYDTIVESKMDLAIKHGAMMVRPTDIIRIMHGIKSNINACDRVSLIKYRSSVPDLQKLVKKYSRGKKVQEAK